MTELSSTVFYRSLCILIIVIHTNNDLEQKIKCEILTPYNLLPLVFSLFLV